MSERRDEIAEKVMVMILERDASWFKDPKPLAYGSYAIAEAMIAQSRLYAEKDKNLPTGKTFTKR